MKHDVYKSQIMDRIDDPKWINKICDENFRACVVLQLVHFEANLYLTIALTY